MFSCNLVGAAGQSDMEGHAEDWMEALDELLGGIED